ncbi:MAG: SIS domain-containing protein [Anaerolineae bacterium]|nr:SIS domain-containing protein [Anaerolineae bacterium]
MADALHISGELLKPYLQPRPLANHERRRLHREPDSDLLTAHMQGGLRAIVLGANPSLASAADNDFVAPHMGPAQQLHALARPGDVLLGISTSGEARNVSLLASVAQAKGLTVIALTGRDGGLSGKAGAHRPSRSIAARGPCPGRAYLPVPLPVRDARGGLLEGGQR